METFLSMREAGNAKYCEFFSEKLFSSKSIWDTIKKEKLPTFTKNSAQTKVTIDKQLVNIKEKCRLMSRFVIKARTSPEIDLPAYFGSYKFFSCSYVTLCNRWMSLLKYGQSKHRTEIIQIATRRM